MSPHRSSDDVAEMPSVDELEPPPRDARVVRPYDARELLVGLEPEAGRLLDRHLGMAIEWFPTTWSPTAWDATSTRSRGRPTARTELVSFLD